MIELSPAALLLLASIRRAGGRPLIVGGAVRDALLGVAPKDIDIEVHGLVDTAALVREIAEVGTVSERGRSFAILAARVEGEEFDVSLPRPGKTTRGQRPGAGSTHEDAVLRDAFAKRDLTINAMGWDPASGEIIDPFGGQHDLDHRVLRATGSAFGDDPLRVWRVVQFAGRFGFQVEHDTAAACSQLALQLRRGSKSIAQERVWIEWSKLLLGGNHWNAAAAALMATGAISLVPELEATRTVAQDPAWHPEGDVFTHLILSAQAAADSCMQQGVTGNERAVAVLGALLHDLGKVTHTQIDTATGNITSHGHAQAGTALAERFMRRIGAPSDIVGRVVPVVAEHMVHVSVEGPPSRTAVRRLTRRLAPATLTDWGRVVDADCTGRGPGAKASPAATWLGVAASDPVGTAPILKGRHLITLGIAPGPDFANLLGRALRAQDDGAFTDEQGALAWARQHLA